MSSMLGKGYVSIPCCPIHGSIMIATYNVGEPTHPSSSQVPLVWPTGRIAPATEFLPPPGDQSLAPFWLWWRMVLFKLGRISVGHLNFAVVPVIFPQKDWNACLVTLPTCQLTQNAPCPSATSLNGNDATSFGPWGKVHCGLPTLIHHLNINCSVNRDPLSCVGVQSCTNILCICSSTNNGRQSGKQKL